MRIGRRAVPRAVACLRQKCARPRDVEIAVQVNGKVRGRLDVPADLSREAAEAYLSERCRRCAGSSRTSRSTSSCSCPEARQHRVLIRPDIVRFRAHTLNKGGIALTNCTPCAGRGAGLTEFLPVSSSGICWCCKRSSASGTAGENLLLIDILLHIGTLVAVLAVYWRRIWEMILHPVKSDLKWLVLATIPRSSRRGVRLRRRV